MSVFYSTKNFILRQSPKSQALVNTKILQNAMHPLHARIRAKFNDPALKHKLVINFTASKKVSKKAVVRNYARRRTRKAVHQVLRERGYGKEGEPLEGGGREKGVTGSLTWFPTFESVNAVWGELKAEVGVAVDRWLDFREKALAGGGKEGGGGGQGRVWELGRRRRESEGRSGLIRGTGATLGKGGSRTREVRGGEDGSVRRSGLIRRV